MFFIFVGGSFVGGSFGGGSFGSLLIVESLLSNVLSLQSSLFYVIHTLFELGVPFNQLFHHSFNVFQHDYTLIVLFFNQFKGVDALLASSPEHIS